MCDYKAALGYLIEFIWEYANDENAQEIANNLVSAGIGKKELEELNLNFVYKDLTNLGAKFNPCYNWDYDLDGPDPSGYTTYSQDVDDDDDEEEHL